MLIDARKAGPCNKNGCTNVAKFNVCFALRVHPNHSPAISTPIVQVCAEHNDVTWDEMYTDEGWRIICEGFRKMGRQEPKVKFSYLEITPISLAQKAFIGSKSLLKVPFFKISSVGRWSSSSPNTGSPLANTISSGFLSSVVK